MSVTGCFQASNVRAQSSLQGANEQPLPLEKRTQINYDAYILGPGDGLQIELLDLPELSGRFSIGPDGTLYLPRLRALYAEGLTIDELRRFLTQQFKTYVRDPQVYVRPVAYRPIRIYVGEKSDVLVTTHSAAIKNYQASPPRQKHCNCKQAQQQRQPAPALGKSQK